MLRLTAQHINIIAKDDIMVNHFCIILIQFVQLLDQIFAFLLDGLDTIVHDLDDA